MLDIAFQYISGGPRNLCKPLKVVKLEYERGVNSVHEVRPQSVVEVVYALSGVSQSLSVQEMVWECLASPTSLDFRLGAHFWRQIRYV